MRYLLLPLVWLLAAPALAQLQTQAQLNEFAQKAEFQFELVANFGPEGRRARVHLINHSSLRLPAGAADWRIYFHSIRNIPEVRAQGLVLRNIQGDLHELFPTDEFAGLAPGERLAVTYQPSYTQAAYSDFMPRAFIARPRLEPAIFANTDTEDLRQFVQPLTRPEQVLRHDEPDLFPVATAESRYAANLTTASARPNPELLHTRIIPQPRSLQVRKGSLTLDNRWQIRYAGRLTVEARYLHARLQEQLGVSLDSQPDHVPASGPVIRLQVVSAGGEQGLSSKGGKSVLGIEAYRLSLARDSILIEAGDNAGAFYGLQSLLQLFPAARAASVELPLLLVEDSPRYSWRGMHYDMARNFHGKAVTLRLVEQMGRYKLNRLHLHLTEDEGWRLEIPGLPELTEIGGQRCFDLKEDRCLLTQLGTGPHTKGSGNGFFTADDFVEILKFAAERHIEVIPEIDMPGHARAPIKAMEARYRRLLAAGDKAGAEQYLLSDPRDTSKYVTVQNYTDNSINVCMESTYRFVDKVVYELQQLYRRAGLQLRTFHMGGDEVGVGSWTASPICAELIARESGVAGVADLKPYFVARVAELTHKRGLALAGWEDGLMYDAVNTFNRREFANDRVLANAWDNIWEWGVADRAYRLANAGYEVILSPATHMYFDHPQETHPEERGYYWAARYSDLAKVFGFMPDHLYANADFTRAGAPIDNLEAMVGRELPPLRKPQNLLGLQGQVWSETIRTPEQLEQMIYPRLLALAERAWHKADWEGDKPDLTKRQAQWQGFARVVAERELPRLAAAGARIYLPPPGARRHQGQVEANVAWPGLVIEWSRDQGKSWQVYTGPLSGGLAAGELLLRSRLGEQVSRVTGL